MRPWCVFLAEASFPCARCEQLLLPWFQVLHFLCKLINVRHGACKDEVRPLTTGSTTQLTYFAFVLITTRRVPYLVFAKTCWNHPDLIDNTSPQLAVACFELCWIGVLEHFYQGLYRSIRNLGTKTIPCITRMERDKTCSTLNDRYRERQDFCFFFEGNNFHLDYLGPRQTHARPQKSVVGFHGKLTTPASKRSYS